MTDCLSRRDLLRGAGLALGTLLVEARGKSLFGHRGVQPPRVRGMRVDPGRLYDLSGFDPAAAAAMVADDARCSHVNPLIVYAHNSVYGAFYHTSFPHVAIEGDLGQRDFLGQLLQQCDKYGIGIVAAVPVNSFKGAWEANPEWRVRSKDGIDYDPDAPQPRQTYPLSGHHDGFVNWYAGLLDDLLTRYPSLIGLEAWEGELDRHWRNEVDHNPEAVRKYHIAYPGGAFDGPAWYQFRAAGLTRLYGVLARTAHAHGKLAFVVQTWAPRSDGCLFTADEIRDFSGIDFDGMMNLPLSERPNAVIAEFIWQMWRAEHANVAFTPDWTRDSARQFVAFSRGRVRPMVHVELTGFPEEQPHVTPTLAEFRQSLTHALHESDGATFYDYVLAKEGSALCVVEEVYRTS